jgi:hypothetical protein
MCPAKIFAYKRIINENGLIIIPNNSIGAKASGLLLIIREFDFLFYVYVLDEVFSKTDILNKSLQSSSLDISTALELAELTIKQLIEMKLDDDFYDNFIEEILEFADTYGIERPSNRKKGRKRVRTETDSTEIDALESYKNLFKEVIDVFINHLSEKFHSDSYKPLIAISTLLTANEKPDLGNIFFDLAIYRHEYDIDDLEKELSIWFDYKAKKNLKTIKEIH